MGQIYIVWVLTFEHQKLIKFTFVHALVYKFQIQSLHTSVGLAVIYGWPGVGARTNAIKLASAGT